MDTELFKEWFQAFAQSAGVTLHVENLYGENNHHIVESCFKGLARALRQAVEIDPRRAGAVPSTKGTLGGSSLITGPGLERLSMTVAIVDYGSGNLRSAAKAFERAAAEAGVSAAITVTDDAGSRPPGRPHRAARRRRLRRLLARLAAVPGLIEALDEAVLKRGTPVSRHLRRHAADGRTRPRIRTSRASAGSGRGRADRPGRPGAEDPAYGLERARSIERPDHPVLAGIAPGDARLFRPLLPLRLHRAMPTELVDRTDYGGPWPR